MKKRTIVEKRLADSDTDQFRQSITAAVKELQLLSITDAILIEGVALPNAVGVQVAHGLGRAPRMIWISPPRGAGTAGVIQDFGDAKPDGSGLPSDRAQFLALRAIGFTSTITVDITVF